MTKEKITRWRKFVEWMKFNPPGALSWDGWDEFTDEFKAKAPIRYTIMETIPGAVKSFFSPVTYRWTITKEFFRYRFVPRHRYHLVNTGLKPAYYDIDTRMLHANFQLLVDFVEKEKAALAMWSDPKEHPRPKGWWWRKYTDWSSPEHGMKHLEWEATLDDIQWDGISPATQAQNARETIVLYRWWKETYIDPDDLEYPESPDDDGLSMFSDKYDRTSPKYIKWRAECDLRDKEEERLRKIESEMLLRLIKIRKSMWT